MSDDTKDYDPFSILPDPCHQPAVNDPPLLTVQPSQVDNQRRPTVLLPQGRKINDQELMDKFNAGATGRELAAYFECSPAAISKRLKRLAPGPPKAIDQLTPKQAAVVKRITAGESAVNAVEQCYETTSRKSAQELSRKILAVPGVQLALQEEMDAQGLTRRYRVTKLAEHCEAVDPGISLKALGLAFTLADEMPAVKSKALVVHANLDPVDLTPFQ